MPAEPREAYYDHPRPEVVALIPPHARSIIDVGCAAGALGQMLKMARPGVEVRGIEPVQAQAARARRVLDDVLVGGAEDPLPEHWPPPDCVIFADVLEHMVDPWRVVRRFRDVLRPGGVVVASIPNVAHLSVIRGLLQQRWDYANEGILDRTHLRFFTRETAIEFFEECGFTVECVQRILDAPEEWRIGGPMGRLIRGALARERKRYRSYPCLPAFLADATTVQFLITAAA